MATKPVNNMVRQVGAKKSVSHPVDQSGTFAFNAGDMVVFDAGVLKAATDANAAKFVGVAQNSSNLALYTKDGAIVANYEQQVECLVGQVHSFKTTPADSLTHLLAVYIGADAQTVVVADPGSGKPIGYVLLRPGQGTITGATGVYVDVLVVPQLPTAGIA